MKKLLVLIATGLCLLPTIAPGVQTAQARMYCLSLRFSRGSAQSGFYSLDLTTLSAGVNGELSPDFFGGGFTHFSYLYLNDEITFEDPIPGVMGLNVPPFADANGNGFPDFFEVSQGVSAYTSGAYDFGFDNGNVTATWNRAAGSHVGSCALNFQGLDTFTHSFELIEYAGPLSYSPGSNTVSGSVSLTQTDNPVNQLQGPVGFVKVATNRFNELTRQPGGWTNGALQTLTFTNDLFLRDLNLLTNYYGYVDFDDGEPITSDPDYYTWVLSIDDLNDVDHDGIPDFSDDPLAARRPLLTLARGATNLLLTVSGDVGRLHEIQQVSTLSSTNWQLVTSVTLTNDPQVVSLPLPSGAPSFWRARVP